MTNKIDELIKRIDEWTKRIDEWTKRIDEWIKRIDDWMETDGRKGLLFPVVSGETNLKPGPELSERSKIVDMCQISLWLCDRLPWSTSRASHCCLSRSIC